MTIDVAIPSYRADPQALHATNMGAGMTRNALLDTSAADYVLFFDDDVQPTAGCIDAYVRAARNHPTAVGFAGTHK